MSYFKINLSQLQAATGDVRNCVNSVESCKNSIMQIHGNCSYGKKTVEIKNQLKAIGNKLQSDIQKLNEMENVMEEVSFTYKDTESRIFNYISDFKFDGIDDIKTTSGSGNTEKKKSTHKKKKKSTFNWNIDDLFIDIIKKVGALGKVVSIISVINKKNKNIAEKIVGVSSGIAGIVENVAGVVANGNNYKALFGLNASEPKGLIKTIWDKVNLFKKADYGNCTNVGAKNVEQIFKNVGNALTFITEGVENFKENDDKGRAIEETIGESAVNILVDSAVAAGIGAAAVGLGVTGGVPAVVVGGATILVKWGLDCVTKKLTDNEDAKFDEVASDFVIDKGKELINVCKGWFGNKAVCVGGG